MARVETIVVGGGIGSVGDLAVGAFLTIATIDPPAVEVASRLGVPVATFDRATHIILGNGIQILGTQTYTNGVVLVGASVELQGNGAATAQEPTIIGNGAIVRSTGGQVQQVVVIGGGASAINATAMTSVVVVGNGAAYTSLGGAVVIGSDANSASQNTTVVGDGATIAASSGNSIAVGQGSAVTGLRCTVVGDGASAVGSDVVAVGQGCTVSGTVQRVVALGTQASVSHNNNFVVNGTSFAANMVLIGNATFIIDTVCIGKGNTSATPNTVTHRQTNGVGTDIPGGNYIITPGLGTGAGLPGDVRLQVGVQLGTGTTLQTARDAVVARFSATALDTYLMVWDVDNAALERVSVGAADSGGLGFKLLRIPN